MKKITWEEFIKLPSDILYVRTYKWWHWIYEWVEYKDDSLWDIDVWVWWLVDIDEEDIIQWKDPIVSKEFSVSRWDYFFKEDEFDIYVLSQDDINRLSKKILWCKWYDVL